MRPLGWAQSVRGRIGRARRYSAVVRIATRHGLGPYLRGRRRAPGVRHELLARELRQALQAGGTTFVKLGQLMSTRRDLLPEVYVEELSLLQDQVPPAPWGEVEAQLRESLGAPAGTCSPPSSGFRWRRPPSRRCTRRCCTTAPR
ncbi:hypothetical protein O1L60_00215 [Streptomyces diastatochromogenes]|nr:hypothetical protein [Streptomyces diastatochromogenes]